MMKNVAVVNVAVSVLSVVVITVVITEKIRKHPVA
tara:strand:- start:386 stop:490 length:105 start_codon:yes stop_codon:yes gene_type:complete